MPQTKVVIKMFCDIHEHLLCQKTNADSSVHETCGCRCHVTFTYPSRESVVAIAQEIWSNKRLWDTLPSSQRANIATHALSKALRTTPSPAYIRAFLQAVEIETSESWSAREFDAKIADLPDQPDMLPGF